jgi:hypothetical protein
MRLPIFFSALAAMLAAVQGYAGVVQVTMTSSPSSASTYSLVLYPTKGPSLGSTPYRFVSGSGVFGATGSADVTFNWDDSTGKLLSFQVNSASVGVGSQTLNFYLNPSAGLMYFFDETFGPATLQYSTGVVPVTGNSTGGGTFLMPSTGVQSQFDFASYSYQYSGSAGGYVGNPSGSSGPFSVDLSPVTGASHVGSVTLVDQGNSTSALTLILGVIALPFDTLRGDTSYGQLSVGLAFTATISTASVPEAGALTLTTLSLVGLGVAYQIRRRVDA